MLPQEIVGYFGSPPLLGGQRVFTIPGHVKMVRLDRSMGDPQPFLFRAPVGASSRFLGKVTPPFVPAFAASPGLPSWPSLAPSLEVVGHPSSLSGSMTVSLQGHLVPKLHPSG